MKAVFDTNILIDYLNGVGKARSELARYDKKLISRITWMEVMAGADGDDVPPVRHFLNRFSVVEISAEVAALAVSVRKTLRLKLPDAIILATARSEGCLLVTRNTKDFSTKSPEIRAPYRL